MAVSSENMTFRHFSTSQSIRSLAQARHAWIWRLFKSSLVAGVRAFRSASKSRSRTVRTVGGLALSIKSSLWMSTAVNFEPFRVVHAIRLFKGGGIRIEFQWSRLGLLTQTSNMNKFTRGWSAFLVPLGHIKIAMEALFFLGQKACLCAVFYRLGMWKWLHLVSSAVGGVSCMELST